MPGWVEASVVAWRERLRLESWSLSLIIAAEVAGNANAWASTDLHPQAHHATITFRDDISPQQTAVWEKVVIHEMIHVSLGNATEFVEGDIFPSLGDVGAAVASAALRRFLEPAVEAIAEALIGR